MDGISVIITTVNRPQVLKRALSSVLNQTYQNIEIIVVVDGAAEETIDFLESNYPDCKIVASSPNVGGSEARNLGIAASNMKYIALLDDDDEWLPNKLEIQLRVLNTYQNDNVCCFSSVYTYHSNPNNKFIFPKNLKQKEEKISDYIFSTKFGFRTGAIQTSTIIAPKSVFEKVPFVKDLPKHQDWTWALDAEKKGINFVHINEPLSIYHKDSNRKGTSQKNFWKFSKQWIDGRKNEIPSNSYYNFMLFVVQNGISKDKTRRSRERLRLIYIENKKIPISYRFTFTYIRYRLQTFYNIIKG